jgi:aryl-alcohol dehydrogenase-like predicted oxidoreductase
VSVGSKWGYTYTADWRPDAEVNEVKDLTIETLRRQEAETRSYLGSTVRLYQIHSATLDSGVLEDRAVLDELARLRDGGLYIGLSVTGPAQGETVLRALEVGGFDCVQATWNLMETSAGPALSAAHDAGLGVLIKEGVANGRLTDRGDARLLLDVAASLGVAPDALALACVLAQPWASVVLSGASTVPTLLSNLGALDVPVSRDVLDRLSGLAEDPAQYWDTRSRLAWN